MRYYRCRCGAAGLWSSMGAAQCKPCKACKTTLCEHPDDHDKFPPLPHDWSQQSVKTDLGLQPLTVCRRCGQLKVDVEAEEKQG